MSNYKKTYELAHCACSAHAMSDAEMGSLLLRVSQSSTKFLNTMDPSVISESDKTYLTPFFNQLLPEIAARLYARDGVALPRRKDIMLTSMTAEQLRISFIEIFNSVTYRELIDAVSETQREDGKLRDIDLCTTPAVNGNISVIALDRIAGPMTEKPDLIAAFLKIAAKVRGVSRQDGQWVPEFAYKIIEDMDVPQVGDWVAELKRLHHEPDSATPLTAPGGLLA